MPLSMHFSLDYFLYDSPMRQFRLAVTAEDGRSTFVSGAHAFMRSLSANSVEELEAAFARTATAIEEGYFQPSACIMAFDGNPYNVVVQEPNFNDKLKYGYWILYTLGEGVDFIGGSLYDMVSDDAKAAAALCKKEDPQFLARSLKERSERIWTKMYMHFLAPKLRRLEEYSFEEKLRSLRASGEILDAEAKEYLWILTSQNPDLTKGGLFNKEHLKDLLQGKFVVDLATAQALGCLSKETDPYLDPRVSKNAEGKWVLSFNLPLEIQLWIFQEACDLNRAHAEKKDLCADIILQDHLIPEGQINLEKIRRNNGLILPYCRENKITGGFFHRYLPGAEQKHLDRLLESNKKAKNEGKPRKPYVQGFEHTYTEVLPTFKKHLPVDTSLELSRASQELKASEEVRQKDQYAFNKRGRTAQEKFFIPNAALNAEIMAFFKTMGWEYFPSYRAGSGIRIPVDANTKEDLNAVIAKHPRLQRFLEEHGQVVSRVLQLRKYMSHDLENPQPGSQNEGTYYVLDFHCIPATLEIEIQAFLKKEEQLALLGEEKEEHDYALESANAYLAELNLAVQKCAHERGLKGNFNLPFTFTYNTAGQIVYRSYIYQRPYPFPSFIPAEKLLFEGADCLVRQTPAYKEYTLELGTWERAGSLEMIRGLIQDPAQIQAFVEEVAEYNVPIHQRVKAEDSLLAKKLREVPDLVVEFAHLPEEKEEVAQDILDALKAAIQLENFNISMTTTYDVKKIEAILISYPKAANTAFYVKQYNAAFTLLELACVYHERGYPGSTGAHLAFLIKTLHSVGKLEAARQSLLKNWERIKNVQYNNPFQIAAMTQAINSTCATLSVPPLLPPADPKFLPQEKPPATPRPHTQPAVTQNSFVTFRPVSFSFQNSSAQPPRTVQSTNLVPPPLNPSVQRTAVPAGSTHQLANLFEYLASLGRSVEVVNRDMTPKQ